MLNTPKTPSIANFRSSICVLVLLVLCGGLLSAQSPDSPRSLKKCWEYSTTDINERGISADNVAVYIPVQGGRVEAVSVYNGNRLWFSDLGGEIISDVAESDAAVFVATRSSVQVNGEPPKTVLRSLSKTTGITNWIAEIPDTNSVFLGLSKTILISVSESGAVTAVEAANGSPLWSVNLNAKITVKPGFSEGDMIVATENKEIRVISTDGGTTIYTKLSSYRPTAVLLLENNKGAWGDERGNLYLFNTKTQKNIWKIKHGAAIADLDGLGETLLATSNDNFAYSVALYNGAIRWKRRQPDRIFGPAMMSAELIVLAPRSGLTSSVLDKERGKTVDNISLDTGDVLIQPPVSGGEKVFFPTGRGILAYSLTGCGGK